MKKLGTGSFAQVWQCRDLRKGGQVAVKVLKSDSFVTEMGEEEAELLANLTKTGKEEILRLLDQFVKDGPNGRHVCLVTELCGPCLLDILPKKGMCLGNVKQIMSQVLAGLDFLHFKRIFHTDIKPENVLLVNKPDPLTNFSCAVEAIKVKLADLGGALQVGDIYPAIVGTSEYRSPELLLEAPYCTKIDVWAAACLGFELATGKYLFKPDSEGMVSKEETHLALITQVLGPAPQDLVRSGRAGKIFYSRMREELHHFPLREMVFEDLEMLIGQRRGKPESEDGVFSQFLLSLLKWTPEERATVGKALQHKFVSKTSIVHAKKVRMSIEEPVDILQDLDKIKMNTTIDPPHQDVMAKKTTESLKEPMLVDKEERARLHIEGIDHVVHEAEEGERSLKSTQFTKRITDCQVNVGGLIQEANIRKGKNRDKKNASKRLCPATKKGLVKQTAGEKWPLITKEIGVIEKSETSCVQELEFPGPSSKRARRSSCPWELDPTSRQLESPFKAKWRTSQEMRRSGRPTNVKGSKLLPMGPLRCYAREMIKVEQGWAREVGESGGYVGGFIDDVVGGERLVVDRPVKEFAYFTLRLRKVYFRRMYHTISYFTGRGLRGSLKAVTMSKPMKLL